MSFTAKYWNQRYIQGETGWDVGEISAPLKEYFNQLDNKTLHILVPGCGNGYEAVWLYSNGFRAVTLLDYSDQVLESFQVKHPDFPVAQIYCEDFFGHEGSYDLIIEQTFFCAIEPARRKEYVLKMADLLAPGGKLAGVLFNRSFEGGPPFGGSEEEYRMLFGDLFEVITMEPCYNSIAPRAGNELFVIMQKK